MSIYISRIQNIATQNNLNLIEVKQLFGGDINEVFLLKCKEGDFVVKLNDATKFPKMFTAETKGLNYLRDSNSFKIPKVLANGEIENTSYLLLQYISNGELNAGFWESFADNLAKTDMVMASHITLPEVTSDGLPASLSREIITDKLRNEMGYDGVIITDSMEMGAITRAYGAESAAMAVKAGCDIVLMPLYFEESFEAVVKAVENGEISEDQINASVLRILELKDKYGII